MALHYELPVCEACYELLLEVFRFTKGFSKEYKYTVGESLKKESMDLLTLIFRANSRKDKTAVPEEARERIEVIRLFVRLIQAQAGSSLRDPAIRDYVRVPKKEVRYVSVQ